MKSLPSETNIKRQRLNRPIWAWATALFAILFGLLTIISGGSVLFNTEVQQMAGSYVGFVLWFNFLAGFAYVIAGVGLWTWQRWSIWLSFSIAITSLIVLAAFGLHILSGGSYEMRTLAAMSLRTMVWFIISALANQKLTPQSEV